MKEIKTFLSKYKYFILINLIIFVSFILIISSVDVFGIDDIKANTYIYNPNFTLVEIINHIWQRIAFWSVRIGEILYFIIGTLPRVVYFILDSFALLIFLNLIYFYIYGTKTKENLITKNIVFLFYWLM